MTVVVTGGSGRLGRSVLRRWVETGETVINLDMSPAEVDGVEDVLGDLLDTVATTRVLHELRPSTVIHLAAIAVPFSAPEERILAVNVGMAYTVLTAGAQAGARRILVATSPTVAGYGAPDGWRPSALPINESHPIAPWNAYAASKAAVEMLVRMAARRDGARTRFGSFRPCYVISPEEWAGAPTQQGHTVRERLERPELAAASLFNYVDARDAAEFTVRWSERADQIANGGTYLVGAADALAVEPLSDLVPRLIPDLADLAEGLTGTAPAFSSAAAARDIGWRPTRSWRNELADQPSATTHPQREEAPL